MYDRPSTPSTPQEIAVIAWGFIVVLLPEKAAIAIQLRNYGLAAWGLAAMVFAIKSVVQKVLWS